MTEIRIRHQDAVDSAVIADVPFDAVDSVIPMLRQWGIRSMGSYVDRDTLSGEFVYEADANEAFFEVTFENVE